MASPKLEIPRRVLSVEEPLECPTASQIPDTIHAQLQIAWFTRAGFPLRNLVQADGFAVLGEMARTGIAVAQLPVGYFRSELKQSSWSGSRCSLSYQMSSTSPSIAVPLVTHWRAPSPR